MLIYFFQTVGSLATTTGYERQFTENRHLPTDYQTSHRTTRKATTIRTLTRRAQLVCDVTRLTAYKTGLTTLTTFLVTTTTTRTLKDETLTVTLNPKLKPTSTLALLRWRLYRTSEAPLKLLHVYYTLQPITTFNYDFLLISRTKTNRKQTETIKCCDWQATYIDETGRNLSTRLTEYKRKTRNGDVNNHLQRKHQIDWDSATCITYSTDYYQRLTLENWFTDLEQTSLNCTQQLRAPYK